MDPMKTVPFGGRTAGNAKGRPGEVHSYGGGVGAEMVILHDLSSANIYIYAENPIREVK